MANAKPRHIRGTGHATNLRKVTRPFHEDRGEIVRSFFTRAIPCVICQSILDYITIINPRQYAQYYYALLDVAEAL